MKINILIILSFVFFLSFSSCRAQDVEVNKLILKDYLINEILQEYAKEASYLKDSKERVFMVKIKKLENDFEIRLGALTKADLSAYLTGKKDNPVGFYEYDGSLTLIFGQGEQLFFKKTSETKKLDFLKRKPILKVGKGKIPPPPVIYEPVVWIYSFKEGILHFTTKGRFTLLE